MLLLLLLSLSCSTITTGIHNDISINAAVIFGRGHCSVKHEAQKHNILRLNNSSNTNSNANSNSNNYDTTSSSSSSSTTTTTTTTNHQRA